jgi:hypothetical protein
MRPKTRRISGYRDFLSLWPPNLTGPLQSSCPPIGTASPGSSRWVGWEIGCTRLFLPSVGTVCESSAYAEQTGKK